MHLALRTHSKINAWLRVLPQRGDEHHLHAITSLFLPVDAGDILVLASRESSDNTFSLSSNRTDLLPGNTVTCAWEKYIHATAGHPGCPTLHVDAFLEKHIPERTGLGAGSGDGAAMLLGMQTLYGSPLATDDLAGIAQQIGSDVPFFLSGHTSIITGVGDTIQPIIPSLPLLFCCLLIPPFRIETAAAYAAIDATMGEANESSADPTVELDSILKALMTRVPFRLPAGARLNSFELVLGEHAVIFHALRDALMQRGALVAGLSGSGSAVFGIYEKRAAALAAARTIRSRNLDLLAIVAQIL